MKPFRVTLLALGLGQALAATGFAACVQTGASQADRDLWATHGCWREYYLWQSRAYDIGSGEWAGRGYRDACNNRLEYPKHWNAAYLVTYGLVDDYSQSFHATEDYRGVAEAAGSAYHNSFYHLPTDRTDIFGAFNGRFLLNDQLFTSCLLYDPLRPNSNPSSRAGDFMHEGWHAWLGKYGWNNGALNGHRPRQGSCTIMSCDYFYFHGISVFEFGTLYRTDGTAETFHSPNQVQVEFLCDVADQPQAWIPATVRLTAAADANTRAVQRFINGPGYSCGSPRPW